MRRHLLAAVATATHRGVAYQGSYPYPFIRTDAGRAQSKRPKQFNDCSVRALALVCNLSYDEAYAMLAKAGRKSCKRFDIADWAAVASVHGHRFVWHPFPAVRGERRMTPISFCEQHPTGRWIVRVSRQVAAVIDGVLYDDAPMRSDRCIYGAWKLVRVPSGAEKEGKRLHMCKSIKASSVNGKTL